MTLSLSEYPTYDSEAFGGLGFGVSTNPGRGQNPEALEARKQPQLERLTVG